MSSGSPQWSPDGTKIVFDSLPVDRWEIYVADLTERKPRKLVTNISDAYFGPTGPAMGSGSISDPMNRARWESIVVPRPGEMPSHYP